MVCPSQAAQFSSPPLSSSSPLGGRVLARGKAAAELLRPSPIGLAGPLACLPALTFQAAATSTGFARLGRNVPPRVSSLASFSELSEFSFSFLFYVVVESPLCSRRPSRSRRTLTSPPLTFRTGYMYSGASIFSVTSR